MDSGTIIWLSDTECDAIACERMGCTGPNPILRAPIRAGYAAALATEQAQPVALKLAMRGINLVAGDCLGMQGLWATSIEYIRRIHDLSAKALAAPPSAAPAGREDALPEFDPSRPRAEQGLYRKFVVRRADGTDAPGGKHDCCEYFVLDRTHDKYAHAALLVYADSCADEYPQLAADLRRDAAREGAAERADAPCADHGFHEHISSQIGGSVRCGTCGAIVTAAGAARSMDGCNGNGVTNPKSPGDHGETYTPPQPSAPSPAPAQGEPTAWIATGPSGRTLHLSKIDGWEVHAVMFNTAREGVAEREIDAIPEPMAVHGSGVGVATSTPSPAPAQDELGVDHSPVGLKMWLHNKWERHGEIEDKLALKLIVDLQAELAEWHKVTAHETPASCHDGINIMYGRMHNAESTLSAHRAALAELVLLNDMGHPSGHGQLDEAMEYRRRERAAWAAAISLVRGKP